MNANPNKNLNPTPVSAAEQPASHRGVIRSRIIYWGIVILMASLLLWLGAELARRIEWILPWSGGFGLAMIALGYFLEIRRSRKRGS